MSIFKTHSASQTIELGEEIGKSITSSKVIAMFGEMGMGKTAFVHGLAKGLGIDDKEVSSPTFAIVHEYSGRLKLYHFDMYRITTWDDLYSTGFFDFLDSGGVLAIEWSENIKNALPEGFMKITFKKGQCDNDRIIEISEDGSK